MVEDSGWRVGELRPELYIKARCCGDGRVMAGPGAQLLESSMTEFVFTVNIWLPYHAATSHCP